jgi:hypothetical protein
MKGIRGGTMEPNIDFRLITFPDVRAAPLSSAVIPGDQLRNCIVLARTRGGNYAKFQAVRSGMNLEIRQLTLYGPDGSVLPPRAPFVVRSSFGCDLENGIETTPAGSDFFWHGISPGVVNLQPELATFALFVDFEALTYKDAVAGPWTTQPVEDFALKHQIIFFRATSWWSPRQTLVAKALVEAQSQRVIVKRLVVWYRGARVLDRSNLSVPSGQWLDLTTGRLVAPYVLSWLHWMMGPSIAWERQRKSSGPWFLVPQNGVEISYPSYYRYAKYVPLLRDPSIRSALAFERPGGYALGYDSWQEELKIQLDEYLYLLDTGRPLPIAGPPPVTITAGFALIGMLDARKAYLGHVAQSLWVDATHAVPWSLARSAVELEYLFDSRRLFSRAATQYYYNTMGQVTAWNAPAAYAFLQTNGFIGADQFETIKRFIDWCRSHLRHITSYTSDPNGPFATWMDQLVWYYGYAGPPPVELMIAPPAGKPHITAGCWGTSGFIAAVLRSVNIPVRHGRTNFSGANHSRPEFFSVGQNLAHGDDPYSRLIGAGHPTPPIDLAFYTDADLAAQIDNPMPLPGKTVAETASANYLRKFGDIAIQYKSEYLLGLRCYDVGNNAPPTATYSRLWQNLHDAYTNAELVQIASDCDTEIAALGGCSQIQPP